LSDSFKTGQVALVHFKAKVVLEAAKGGRQQKLAFGHRGG